MSTRLDSVYGTVEFDNLIHSPYPPAEVFSIQLAAGQGVLARGSLLALVDGVMSLISEETTGKANAILAEEVDTGEASETEDAESDGEGTATDTVYGIAYRTGHFNENVLIVADGYEITADDKEALRSAGILLSDAVEM